MLIYFVAIESTHTENCAQQCGQSQQNIGSIPQCHPVGLYTRCKRFFSFILCTSRRRNAHPFIQPKRILNDGGNPRQDQRLVLEKSLEGRNPLTAWISLQFLFTRVRLPLDCGRVNTRALKRSPHFVLWFLSTCELCDQNLFYLVILGLLVQVGRHF